MNSRRAQAFTAWYYMLVFAAGAVAFTISFFLAEISDPIALAAIVALAIACERFAVRLYAEGRVSVSFVAIVLAAISFGAPGTALVAAAVALAGVYFFSGGSREKLVLNFGIINVGGFAAWSTVAAWANLAGERNPLGLLAAGTMGGAVFFLVTGWAVTFALAGRTGQSVLAFYRTNCAWLAPHYLALGLMGGCLAVAYDRLGIAGVLVLAVPVLMSRYSIKQVMDKTRENVMRLERSNLQLQNAHTEIRAMSDELREAYNGTLESLVAALDVRDQETGGHSIRVATHSLEIARVIGIKDEQELGMVYRGALMHDVGKIGVPDAILLKPGSLTEEEWVFMRKHAALGYRILAQVPYLRPAARIVLAHHERWDGGGYPRGLKGEDVPLGARIFALSDTYDAIINDRPYRKGRTPDEALAEILRCAGTQFDPKIVEAFEALFPLWREETIGSRVRPLYLPEFKERSGQPERRAG